MGKPSTESSQFTTSQVLVSVTAEILYHSVAQVAPEVKRIPLPKSSEVNPEKNNVPSGASIVVPAVAPAVPSVCTLIVPPVALVRIEAWVLDKEAITRRFCPNQLPARAPPPMTERT